MEFKDRKFRFMDSVWTIKFVDRITEDETSGTTFGLCDPDRRTITIGLKDIDGKPYKKEQIMHTLRHELMHMVLFEGQYNDCYIDEPLVEWLSSAIGILLKSKLLEI